MGVGGEDREWGPLAAALGRRVTQERERLGITKEELGERSGLAARYVWRLEAGRQNAQLASIGRVARGLGATLSSLMDGVGDPDDGDDVGIGDRRDGRGWDRT